MKNHTNCCKAFHWSAKAWYHDPRYGNEINFGMYSRKGGTSGEMTMRWDKLSGDIVPQLRVYSDAWRALSLFTDLLRALGEHDNENITQEQFVEILLQCGFEDLTGYKSPYEPKETELRKELSELEQRCKEIKDVLNG